MEGTAETCKCVSLQIWFQLVTPLHWRSTCGQHSSLEANDPTIEPNVQKIDTESVLKGWTWLTWCWYSGHCIITKKHTYVTPTVSLSLTLSLTTPIFHFFTVYTTEWDAVMFAFASPIGKTETLYLLLIENSFRPFADTE